MEFVQDHSDVATTAHDPITRTAVWSSKHPWLVLIIWVLLVTASFGMKFMIDTRQATDIEKISGESQHAAQLAHDAGLREPATELILVTRADGAKFSADATTQSQGDDILNAIESTEHVESVTGPIPSDDETAVLYQAAIDGDSDTAWERFEPLQQTTADLDAKYADLVVEQTGDVSIAEDFQGWLGTDLDVATTVSIPATLIILLIAFAAVVMGLVPLVVGSASVLSAMGLWAVVSQAVPDQGLVNHVILLIGMAVGVDYALFYSRRFRDEKHAGSGPVDATVVAAKTAGHSVIVSGTAVALAMAGLLFIGDTLFSGIAWGAILVVFIAIISSLTAMPALMRLLHRWVDRPRVPFVWRLTNSGKEPEGLRRLLRPVVRHPRISFILSLAALAALAMPAMGMKLTTTTVDDYPRALPSLATYDHVLEKFPNETSSARVVIQADDEHAPFAEIVDSIAEQTAAKPGVFGELAEPWYSADGRTLILDVALLHKTETQEAKDTVRELRDTIVPEAVNGHGTFVTAVGGDVASNLDTTDNLAEKMPWVIGIVIVLTFLFMFIVYRSLVIAVTTVVLNIGSTLASFGLLTLIFQHTWAEGVLGFTSNGHLTSWVPLMLFVILSGLSLDYHVLVVNRIREYARAGMTVSRSVLEGVTATAGVVGAAAAVMITVFAVFGGLSFIELKEIGVGLAIATLLDVTLLRLVALPAAMVSFSRVLWWPGRLRQNERTADSEKGIG